MGFKWPSGAPSITDTGSPLQLLLDGFLEWRCRL